MKGDEVMNESTVTVKGDSGRQRQTKELAVDGQKGW